MENKQYNITIIIEGKDAASTALGRVGQGLGAVSAIAGGSLLAGGIQAITAGFMSMGQRALASAMQLQGLELSLQTLTARESVAAGEAESIDTALGQVGGTADDLKNKLKALALTSPFEFSSISEIFRLQMAFGAGADASVDLTRAITNTAAGLGLTSDAVNRLAYNFAQIRSIGKITGIDLRQLRMVGLDLAAVFSSQLSMSIDEVNAALESGKLTMDDVSSAFVKYADENFGGAAERMSRTFQGLQSSMNDLMFFAGGDTLTPILEIVTERLGGAFDELRALVDSGYFERLGEGMGGNLERVFNIIDQGGIDTTEIVKILGDGLLRLTDAAADLLEWWVALDPGTKQLYTDMALLAVGVGPATQAIGFATQAVKLFTSGLLAANLAALAGPAALAALAVAAYELYKMNQQVSAGVEKTTEGWTGFYETIQEQELNAAATADQIIAKRQEVIDIYDSYDVVTQTVLGDVSKLLGSEAELSATVAAASDSYAEYVAQMLRVAGEAGRLTEQQYTYLSSLEDVDEAADALGVSTRRAFAAQKMFAGAVSASAPALQAAAIDYAGAAEALKSIWINAGSWGEEAIVETPVFVMTLADSFGILKSTLQEFGYTGPVIEEVMAGLQIQTGALSAEQYKLQSDVQLVSQAFSAGIMNAEQLGIFLQWAADGTLNLGTAQREFLAGGVAYEQSLAAMKLAAEELTLTQLNLTSSLKGATNAQIAQVMVGLIEQSYQDGTLSLEDYITSVVSIQTTFGLADAKSIALAGSVIALNQAFTQGAIPAANVDDALKAIIADAPDGVVEIDKILEKFSTVGDSTAATLTGTKMVESFNSYNTRLITMEQTAQETAQGVDQSFSRYDWTGAGWQVGAGLAQGMTNSIPLVTAAGVALATAAQLAVEDAMGMDSPSKVMAYLGEMAGTGFDLGLMRSAENSGAGAAFAEQVASQVTTSYANSETYNVSVNDYRALDLMLDKQKQARIERAEGLLYG